MLLCGLSCPFWLNFLNRGSYIIIPFTSLHLALCHILYLEAHIQPSGKSEIAGKGRILMTSLTLFTYHRGRILYLLDILKYLKTKQNNKKTRQNKQLNNGRFSWCFNLAPRSCTFFTFFWKQVKVMKDDNDYKIATQRELKLQAEARNKGKLRLPIF